MKIVANCREALKHAWCGSCSSPAFSRSWRSRCRYSMAICRSRPTPSPLSALATGGAFVACLVAQKTVSGENQ